MAGEAEDIRRFLNAFSRVQLEQALEFGLLSSTQKKFATDIIKGSDIDSPLPQLLESKGGARSCSKGSVRKNKDVPAAAVAPPSPSQISPRVKRVAEENM